MKFLQFEAIRESDHLPKRRTTGKKKERNSHSTETVSAGELRDVLVVVKAQRALELIFLGLLVLFESLIPVQLSVRF